MSFGDAFLLDSFLRSSGLMACADACGHAEPDTVRALLAFYVLTGLANRHAGDWWELTYARLPCPRARMASQRAGECLADLGSEDAKRRFMGEYLALVGRRGETDGILIDSTGPSNSCRLPPRPSPTTTARSARRSASSTSRSATRACPSSSATSPAT